ncbi:hypothetical protein CK203_046460 [Vitis vinifera]|uniref:Integrase catalytic domain-containing protein n=1 Tax=Vitis vinifera TaxID=29760 RepID=A0A438I1W1_VITVI|nr:hypothetical protein CK203_046460 [Vitis vinifera]
MASEHHRSSAYRPQMNGAVEAANKNIKRILQRMVEISRDWSEKLPFALWAYQTSFRTSNRSHTLFIGIRYGGGATTQSLDERRLRAADHVHAYQKEDGPRFQKAGQAHTTTDRELTPEGAAWLMDLDGNRFSKMTNVDQLKRGTFFSLSFPITAPLHFHLISLVVFFVSSSLSYLLLVLFHILSTLSGDPPQFITWRIVTSFPPSISRTLV